VDLYKNPRIHQCECAANLTLTAPTMTKNAFVQGHVCTIGDYWTAKCPKYYIPFVSFPNFV